MLPITLLAATKLAGLLKASAALEANVNELAAANQTTVPIIPSTQVFVSSAPVGAADLQPELAYPRVNVFAARLKNNQAERFRSVSGSVFGCRRDCRNQRLAGTGRPVDSFLCRSSLYNPAGEPRRLGRRFVLFRRL
jgi:hypothetical protein